MLPISNNQSKVVVITGASAGIGRAAVRRFAAEGYHVGLIARGRDGLEAAAAEVEQHGVRRSFCLATFPMRIVSRMQPVKRKSSLGPSTFGSMTPWYPSFRRLKR